MSKLSVRDCIGSGYSSVLINTTEETRAIKECLQASIEYGIKLFGWTCTRGIVEILPYEVEDEPEDEAEDDTDVNYYNELTREIEENPEEYEVMDGYVFKKRDPDMTDPQEALVKGLELNGGEGKYIFCIIDFHHYLNQPMVLRAAKDAFEKAENLGVSYIFISSKFEVPADWQETIISIELELPTKEDLVDSFNETIRYIDRNNKGMLHMRSFPENARGDVAASFVVNDMVSGTLVERKAWYACGALLQKNAEPKFFVNKKGGRNFYRLNVYTG